MIGDKIKALRVHKKLTQEAVAKKLFISPQAVSRWEQGLAVPDTALLVPLADILGVSVDYLLRDPEQCYGTDFEAAFHIRYEFEGAFLLVHIKNVSAHSFERVGVRINYLGDDDSVIDYRTFHFYDSEPNTTKIERSIHYPLRKSKKVKIYVTDCCLK